MWHRSHNICSFAAAYLLGCVPAPTPTVLCTAADDKTLERAIPRPGPGHTKIIYYSCAAVSVGCAWHANNLAWWTINGSVFAESLAARRSGSICCSLLVCLCVWVCVWCMRTVVCSHSDQPNVGRSIDNVRRHCWSELIPFSVTLQMVRKNQPYELYECENVDWPSLKMSKRSGTSNNKNARRLDG